MQDRIDQEYMQRALTLAARAMGRTSPNPVVGAVLVRDRQLVGEGYHRKAGSPHAEIMALQRAGEKARGSTLYVTLEPCCHQGRTPPCCEALIEAGISRVVAATLDPNPRVAGNGMKRIKAAGISTRVGVLQDQAAKQNEFFFKYISSGLPFVTLKTAMTLDGKIATVSGSSRWISSESSREYVHRLRNIYDAIMVGIGTVLADDPQLNTRLPVDDRRDPLRVILDGELQLPLTSKIALSSREQKTLLFCNQVKDQDRADSIKACGIEIIEMDGEGPILDLEKIMAELGSREICSVLLEGGAEVNAAMLTRGLVDKVHWFVAPKVAGGRLAPGPIGGQGISLMEDALNLKDIAWQQLGPDLLLTAYTGW